MSAPSSSAGAIRSPSTPGSSAEVDGTGALNWRCRSAGGTSGTVEESRTTPRLRGHPRRPGRPTSVAAPFACRLPGDNPRLPRRGGWPRCACRARNSPRSTGTNTRPRSHRALGRASHRTTGFPGRSRPRATHRPRRPSPSAKRSNRGRARVSSSKREISSSLTAPCSSLGRMRIPRLIVIVRKARTIAPRRPEGQGATARLLIRPALGEECDARSALDGGRLDHRRGRRARCPPRRGCRASGRRRSGPPPLRSIGRVRRGRHSRPSSAGS